MLLVLAPQGTRDVLATNGATWTVPAGITLASFLLSGTGGTGGQGNRVSLVDYGGGGGGAAGCAYAVIAVTAGEVFTLTRSGSTTTLSCTTGVAGTIVVTDGDGGGLGGIGGLPGVGGLAGTVTARTGRFAAAAIVGLQTGFDGVGATGGAPGSVADGRAGALLTPPSYGIGGRGGNGPSAFGTAGRPFVAIIRTGSSL
jgi:hypothetical protein